MKETDPRIDIARHNLRMAVAMRNTNPSDVSRKAGMSRNGLGQFLAGRTTLSYANMLAICDVLQLPLTIVHRPDSITETKVRLYQTLDRIPDHLMQKALQIVQDQTKPQG